LIKYILKLPCFKITHFKIAIAKHTLFFKRKKKKLINKFNTDPMAGQEFWTQKVLNPLFKSCPVMVRQCIFSAEWFGPGSIGLKNTTIYQFVPANSWALGLHHLNQQIVWICWWTYHSNHPNGLHCSIGPACSCSFYWHASASWSGHVSR
jgi:hypothetical protein